MAVVGPSEFFSLAAHWLPNMLPAAATDSKIPNPNESRRRISCTNRTWTASWNCADGLIAWPKTPSETATPLPQAGIMQHEQSWLNGTHGPEAAISNPQGRPSSVFMRILAIRMAVERSSIFLKYNHESCSFC
ncbi:hypothetical protein SAMN05444955_10662 [Lihuaxuella thermophila]|uniref:Uncharacterized protein n=1 Tax=Lihuaxuella thermophila TaxID=1173111 RepID=A0A1H8E1U1_9BACL|nr:hypothetical protein SAMN05444955_10662 [Lihuaxuella thermophila]